MKFIKRIAHFLIGNSPFRTVKFDYFLNQSIEKFVEIPESLTSILKHEKGGIIHYKYSSNSFNSNLAIRKIRHKFRYIENGLLPEPDRFLYSLENGAIISSTGIVYDPRSRRAILESALEWSYPLSENPVFYSPRVGIPIIHKGVALSIATIGADGGYYHFFHESLPKLYFTLSILKSVDYILISGEKLGWKLKWLNRIGIDESKIIWLSNTSHFQFDQLLFTSKLVKDHQPSVWGVNSLKNLLKIDNKNKSPFKVIFSSRKLATHRTLKWENDIQIKFPQIEFVDFTELSPDETIKVCQDAKYFIGPHGAGFSNIIFCISGTTVLELFPDGNFIPLYSRLAQVCDLKHYAIKLNFQNSDSEEGIEHLDRILKELIH